MVSILKGGVIIESDAILERVRYFKKSATFNMPEIFRSLRKVFSS